MVNKLGSSCLKVGCDADDRMSNFAQDCDVTVTPDVLDESDAMHSASSVVKIFVIFKVVLSRLYLLVDYHLFE